MQVGWIYEHELDIDGLNRFHHNLGQGLLGRLIERSPLPFGRHRWVVDPQPAEIEFTDGARPRAEVGDWFDERTQLAIDPEIGPGWRLSVVQLTDGSSAVSLVLSHYVIDGIGGAVAVTEALLGMTRDLGYPPPRSRHRLRAAVEDARESVGEVPGVARALVAAVKEARRRRQIVEQPQPVQPNAVAPIGADEPFTAPSVWIQLRLDDWNACATALDGTASTLAAAFTAKLDEHMGRRHGSAGGVVTMLTVNDRTTADDTRAVAVSFTRACIDPTDVTKNLSDARAAVKRALTTFKETKDESTELVALTPFTPKAAWRHMVEYSLHDPEHPAVCSNLGDTGPVAIRPDGTLCTVAFARGASQHNTRRRLDRVGGQLHVYYGTSVEINLVSIYVCAYHPGSVTTKAQLRALAARSLADFDLSGTIE